MRLFFFYLVLGGRVSTMGPRGLQKSDHGEAGNRCTLDSRCHALQHVSEHRERWFNVRPTSQTLT